jgi:hypothetical protein
MLFDVQHHIDHGELRVDFERCYVRNWGNCRLLGHSVSHSLSGYSRGTDNFARDLQERLGILAYRPAAATQIAEERAVATEPVAAGLQSSGSIHIELPGPVRVSFGEADPSLAEGPERSPLHSFG